MVYRRSQRPTFYMEAKTRTGFKQVCTHARDKKLAQRIEHMWAELAAVRAWDLLEPVLDGALTIGALYDRWSTTRGDLAAMRLLAADVDLAPLVDEWIAVYRNTKVSEDTAKHALHQVRWLLPAGTVRLVSSVSADWLTERLAAYPGKRNTLRKVHSHWTTFFAFAVLKRRFAANPMSQVERPTEETSEIRFYELDTVERIVGHQPTIERRVLFALLYGTAADLSSALPVTRADLLPGDKAVRIRGTKATARDRICRIADWAWPTIWRYATDMLPAAPLFPATFNRWTCSDWHRETVEALALAPDLPLRNARHHWAATRMRAGVPVEVVSRQLGHGSAQLTHKLYGRFEPKAEDRDSAESKTAAYETKRREAK